jgi:hypothetical protein
MRLAALAAACALAATAARADRPFIAVTGAAAEEDDDRMWSATAAVERRRAATQLGVSAEYAFDPVSSVELSIGRSRLRDAGASSTETELEFEFKQLFNHIARDGWGWGVALGTGARRQGGGWRGGAWSLVVPVSLQWGEGGAALVHANAGLVREVGERRASLLALGIEGEVARRVVLFAEAAREGDAKLLHGGARWWLQREKLALDIGIVRRRAGDAAAGTGVTLALSRYDL